MLIGKLPENCSNQHKKVVGILNMIKPHHKIYLEKNASKLFKERSDEDNPILIGQSSKLNFDIYDETWNIAFEIQGVQHDKFNEFFHKDLGGLDRQRYNDKLKKLVCKYTGTRLIEINTDDEIDEELINSFYRLE